MSNDRLKTIFKRPQIDLLMEAHNGLSAKIVEKCGFEAIWASGLSIATSYGVRDCNELSWTQLVDSIGFITDAVRIPVLVDGDSGFGDFNNVRRLVTKLERVGASGVVIEDKLFPKQNSFIGEKQKLCDIEEFTGKIKSAVDHRKSDNFLIVARLESLISGFDVHHALNRAERYLEAGCDAIFIHSKKQDAEEILCFADLWASRCPVIIAPTTYYKVPFSVYENRGISACICANQNVRAAKKAMRELCDQIMRDQSLINIEKEISPLKDLFEIMDYDELEAAERMYLPNKLKEQN